VAPRLHAADVLTRSCPRAACRRTGRRRWPPC
jgi:hypothetical protein